MLLWSSPPPHPPASQNAAPTFVSPLSLLVSHICSWQPHLSLPTKRHLKTNYLSVWAQGRWQCKSHYCFNQMSSRTFHINYLRLPLSAISCASLLGYAGDKQVVSLQRFGCIKKGIIQHEVLHALGFYHEHTRSDRNNYVRINWENIYQCKILTSTSTIPIDRFICLVDTYWDCFSRQLPLTTSDRWTRTISTPRTTTPLWCTMEGERERADVSHFHKRVSAESKHVSE